MSYNSEKPQFWQPFSLPGYRKIVSLPRAYHLGYGIEAIKALDGTDARHVVYAEYNEDAPLHELTGNGGFAFSRHLSRLEMVNPDLGVPIRCSIEDGEPIIGSGINSYRHSFIWRNRDYVMVDSWLTHLGEDNYPISTARVFCDLDEVDPAEFGHAGGNTLIVMGEEEKFRRKMMKMGKSLTEFAHRTRQNMPNFEPGFIARARLKRR